MWLCKLEIPLVSVRELRSCSDWLVGTELAIGLDVAVESSSGLGNGLCYLSFSFGTFVIIRVLVCRG